MFDNKPAMRKRMRLKIVKQREGRAVQNKMSNRLLSVGNPLLGKYFALFASQINSPSLIFFKVHTTAVVIKRFSQGFLCLFSGLYDLTVTDVLNIRSLHHF